MNHKDYFLALLRASLWQKPITGGVIAHPVCRSMITAAKKQTVLGLLSDALLAPENSFQLDRQTVIELLVAKRLQNKISALIRCWWNCVNCCGHMLLSLLW